MIKNDAIDEVFDLTNRWNCLKEDLYEDEFDYDFFKLLAAHTFAYLFPYHSEENLPREMMQVLFAIKEFASCPVGGISPEADAAQQVAAEFCNQIEDCWVQIDGKFDEDRFAVFFDKGDFIMDFIIDANTFDLTPLL